MIFFKPINSAHSDFSNSIYYSFSSSRIPHVFSSHRSYFQPPSPPSSPSLPSSTHSPPSQICWPSSLHTLSWLPWNQCLWLHPSQILSHLHSTHWWQPTTSISYFAREWNELPVSFVAVSGAEAFECLAGALSSEWRRRRRGCRGGTSFHPGHSMTSLWSTRKLSILFWCSSRFLAVFSENFCFSSVEGVVFVQRCQSCSRRWGDRFLLECSWYRESCERDGCWEPFRGAMAHFTWCRNFLWTLDPSHNRLNNFDSTRAPTPARRQQLTHSRSLKETWYSSSPFSRLWYCESSSPGNQYVAARGHHQGPDFTDPNTAPTSNSNSGDSTNFCTFKYFIN